HAPVSAIPLRRGGRHTVASRPRYPKARSPPSPYARLAFAAGSRALLHTSEAPRRIDLLHSLHRRTIPTSPLMQCCAVPRSFGNARDLHSSALALDHTRLSGGKC